MRIIAIFENNNNQVLTMLPQNAHNKQLLTAQSSMCNGDESVLQVNR